MKWSGVGFLMGREAKFFAHREGELIFVNDSPRQLDVKVSIFKLHKNECMKMIPSKRI